MSTELQVKERQPNWLPLPGVEDSGRVQELSEVDETDKFSKATVEEFYPRQGYGYIKTDGGQRVMFDVRLVRLVGHTADARYLKEGHRVGYDLGKTHQGPRVSTLKIY